MRRLTEEPRAAIAAFIGQREALTLLVGSSDSDAAATMKIIEGLDEASVSEIFWVVVDDFDNADAFVEACVKSFSAKHQAIRLAMEQQGMTPWSVLPDVLTRRDAFLPLERLRQLVMFSRSLLPRLDGSAVVWAFLPLQIANHAAYAELMAGMCQHEYPFPWCHHVRFVVREDPTDEALARRMATVPAVQRLRVDFSPEAVEKAITGEAEDDAAPLADRINSTLVLAGIDYSHRRYERALRGYQVVHRHAATTNNPTLAAVALNGMGEVWRETGNDDESANFFQAAIAPAAVAPGPPVPILFNIYRNLGNLRFKQERWSEAEVYFQGAGEFALLLHDAEQRLQCWDRLGQAQLRQAKSDDALKTWTNGAIVAGRLALPHSYETFSRHITQFYERQHNDDDDDDDGFQARMREIRSAIENQDGDLAKAGRDLRN